MEKKMAVSATSSTSYSLLASEKSLSINSMLRIPQAIMILEDLARKLVSGKITNYSDLGDEFHEFKQRISKFMDIFSGTQKKLDMAFSAQLDKSCKEIFDEDKPGVISQRSQNLLARMNTIYNSFPCWAESTAPPKDIWKNFDFRAHLLALEKSPPTNPDTRIYQVIESCKDLARELVLGDITNCSDLGREFPQFKQLVLHLIPPSSMAQDTLDKSLSAQLDKSCKEIFDEDAPGEISQRSRDLLNRMSKIHDSFPCWKKFTAHPRDIWKNLNFRVKQIVDDLIEYAEKNETISKENVINFLTSKFLTSKSCLEIPCPKEFGNYITSTVLLEITNITITTDSPEVKRLGDTISGINPRIHQSV
jgi:hypothetical protein